MSASRRLGTPLAFALALLGAEPARGQMESGRWHVMPTFGLYAYDDATPFETSGFVGGEGHLVINRVVSVGLSLSFARPEVDGSYFPLAIFKIHRDTTILFETGQQVTHVGYAGLVSVGFPLGGRGQVFVQGGLGGYTIFMDRQVIGEILQRTDRTSVTDLMIPVGAGITYFVGSRVGFRLQVRDDIFTGFDREVFNPVEPRFQNTCQLTDFCIQEANRTPPEPSSSPHNFRFMIGFEFVPGF